MAERKPIKRVMLFAGITLIPVFFIYIFVNAKQVFIELPYYGPVTITNGDTSYYKIPDFKFTDHLGNEVSNKTLEGKVIILNTAVNSCPENCTMAINEFTEHVYKRMAHSSEMGDVVIVTHIVARDSNEVVEPRLVIEDLHQKSEKIDFDKWKFVTGDYNPIYDMDIELSDSIGPKNYYRTFDKSGNIVGGRWSNSVMLLIDHDGHVRGCVPAVHNSMTEIEKQAALLCILKRKKISIK